MVSASAQVTGAPAQELDARIAVEESADVLSGGTVLASDGLSLLPVGVVVDRAETIGDVVHIDVTFPAVSRNREWTPLEAQEISERFASGIQSDLDFGGVIVRFRFGPDDTYAALDDLASGDSTPITYPPLREDAALVTALAPDEGNELRSATFANAGHQPTGALSGVVIYAAAGHGWTWNGSSWGLQRPLLLNMIEDYGNLDQLNYFVNYAFNAGATIVPLRPIGYQDNEVVLDQDDPQVSYTGGWANSSSQPYYENGVTNSGFGYRFAEASGSETATAHYTPNLPESGYYPVYTWVLDSANRTVQKYRIAHTGGLTEVAVDHRMVGRGWVWLGSYHFAAGNGGYVEISNQSGVAGNAIADAIRFGNGIGDLGGGGGGTLSSYPRDEEAQRYWAESETNVNAVGMPTSIYNCCSSDSNDNVGTGARWAREMNNTSVNNNRWQRIYLEFHSNASSGAARGTVGLVTTSPTTNQNLYATILGDEIEADMLILDSGFEHLWGARSNPANGSFGAISTSNNNNEFDATILEVAFHDNAQDAQLLLDPKVRDAVARSSVHGIVKFLNNISAGAIPLSFAPTAPRQVRAIADGTGQVTLIWQAPITGEAYGQAATGYRVYRSSNGKGFDAGDDVGGVLSTTLGDVPPDTTTYFRVAAYNAGGESLPSEVIAVRLDGANPSSVLIVNGFDRVSRSQNPQQTLSGVGTQRRPLIRKVNSFDYVIQHAAALAAAGVTFDSCQNESVANGSISLEDYAGVVWICGEESSADATFDSAEQTIVSSYLSVGGNLFVSGAEIGWDLDNLGNGVSFYNNSLKADYAGDDAGTYNVSSAPGSVFDGIGSFSFDNGTLFYDVEFPDQLTPLGGSVSALNYVGGGGGIAGIAFDGAFRVINLGFPFETITSSLIRDQLMDAAVTFFDLDANPPPPSVVIVESRDSGGAVTSSPTYQESGTVLSNDSIKSTAAGLSGFGSRYVEYDVPNMDADNATFTPDIPIGGKYEVFATWGADANAANIQITVNHRNGAAVSVESQIPSSFGGLSNANLWLSLGEFWFDVGQDAPTGSVNISEEGVNAQPSGALPRRVYFDAARWIRTRLLPNGDTNDDVVVDLADYAVMADCITGPGQGYAQPACEDFDFDVDGDVDMDDVSQFQIVFDIP